ncbi:hypothetical protein THF1C08_170001 [Vibrio jasicida]|uniref:Uncharacterized protein n=1 Tax=Vibrio jasicida TaxID=766224 RepID=A0AAU9QHJ6_9VIBR|nr:hypothetical protein THF1C08_170001 [Vibrio jasicida]CAH1579546.1 hypothetical protein THF1A12_160001 [Vibrio jasicida]
MVIDFIVSESDADKDLYEYKILFDGKIAYKNVDFLDEEFEVLEGSEIDLNQEGVDAVFNLPLEALPKLFSYEGQLNVQLDCLVSDIYVHVVEGKVSISYSMLYDLDMLSVGNLGNFLDEVSGLALGSDFSPNSEIDLEHLEISLSGESSDSYNSIADCINDDLKKIESIDSYIRDSYIDNNTEDVFIGRFNFPPEYKHLCTQYLLWFGELLSNLNLDVDVWTEMDGNSTKLMVNYDKDPILMEKIEEIFYQYIQLPYVDFIPSNNSLTPEQRYLLNSLESQVDDYKNKIKQKEHIISYLALEKEGYINKINEMQNKNALLIESAESKDKVERYSLFNGAINIDRIQPLNKNKTAFLDLSVIFGKPNS